MDCPDCQTPLPANARFCLHCGSKVPQVLTCRECGTELPEGSRFCLSCGTKQGDYNIASRTASAPTQKVVAGGTANNHIQPAEKMAPGTVFRDGDGLPEMVVIPAGEFMMGCAGAMFTNMPHHRVVIARAFAIGRYAVTFNEFERFVDETAYDHDLDDRNWGKDRQPIIDVSGKDARAYSEWISLRTSAQYRLPSEAEWEYAARARTCSNYYWGDEPRLEYANYSGCGDISHNSKPLPVGSYLPNPWGLYEMLGNVEEWCEDEWLHKHHDVPPSDGSSWLGHGTAQVLRGGNFRQDMKGVTLNTDRTHSGRWTRSITYGFRLVREL